MKKRYKIVLVVAVLLGLLGGALLGFLSLIDEKENVKKHKWDNEYTINFKKSIKTRGDYLLIEEYYIEYKAKNGKGILQQNIRRAKCSISKNKCLIEEWDDGRWVKIGIYTLDEILGKKEKNNNLKTTKG